MKVFQTLYRFRRRLFGTYAIEDPRPIAAGAPYTFYIPSENELLALAPGDLVKLVICSIPKSHEHAAERMWVTITAIDGDRMAGDLANEPFDMPQLRYGSRVAFDRWSIIDIEWAEDRSVRPPPAPQHRWYWDRCLVDACIADDGIAVEYLYREDPDMTLDGDANPDSGWRIRADGRGLTDEELGALASEYVALGRVLNADDSWLHLIDAPIGSAFLRNWETGLYEPCDSPPTGD